MKRLTTMCTVLLLAVGTLAGSAAAFQQADPEIVLDGSSTPPSGASRLKERLDGQIPTLADLFNGMSVPRVDGTQWRLAFAAKEEPPCPGSAVVLPPDMREFVDQPIGEPERASQMVNYAVARGLWENLVDRLALDLDPPNGQFRAFRDAVAHGLMTGEGTDGTCLPAPDTLQPRRGGHR